MRYGLTFIGINEGSTSYPIQQIVSEGLVPLVFVSPEIALSATFNSQVYQQAAFKARLLSIVIDEAHCVSEWGGSFRPEYSRLGTLRGRGRTDVPLIAASATLSAHG